jgi:hypothetical protein
MKDGVWRSRSASVDVVATRFGSTDEITGPIAFMNCVGSVSVRMRIGKGRVHTNGIENFWSLLKRGLNGTYVAVEPFHLDAYVDEQVFRFNNRATKDNPLTDADRFALALSQISGKRLTYAELTGKVGETESRES